MTSNDTIIAGDGDNVIVGHCYDGYPDEACGLLTGKLIGTESDGR